MSTRYTREELEEYFFEALAMFNDVLESNITSENVVLDFFTPANGLAVYKRFCEKYFPYKNEQHQKWVQRCFSRIFSKKCDI